MKKSSFFFVWVMLLAIGIMVVITATQFITSRSQKALELGNKQAVVTFNINNRLEELTSLSFALENKILAISDNATKKINDGIIDSLTQLGYNVSVLQKLWLKEAKSARLNNLVSNINNQINFSLKISDALETKTANATKLLDSFATKHYGDSVYAQALAFQKELEKLLSKNFENNNKSTEELGLLNFLLAVISLLAILILVSIIIKRQQKQLALIEDLKVARRHALKSNEIKDQFLANMSHEIRTPLNALQGFSKLMLDTNLTEDQKKYSSIISSASNNLLTIVNDILDFSKIESNILTIKKTPFLISKEIDNIQKLLQKLADDKNLQLNFNLAQYTDTILYGDAGRLNQILINLIGNAIKFTEKGSINITINTIAENEIEKTINFIITDTGQGIPENKLQTIFERFEQIDNSFSRQQGGTGLGLAIVKKLATLMSGQIFVTSTLNSGTTFTLSLPFEKNNNLLQQNFENNNDYIDTELLKNCSILVAEDNAMNQLLITQILKKFNVKVSIAHNGKEALQILEKQPVNLLLMDVQMPVMDGVTATKNIRALFGDKLPIVAMTAHVMENEKQKCLQAGMNEYLTKPINEHLLYQTIVKLVQKNSQKNDQIINHQYIGFKYINEICNNNVQQVNAILNTLCDNIPKEIAEISHILNNKEFGLLKKKLHHLKSTFSPLDEDTFVNKTLFNLEKNLENNNDPAFILNNTEKLIADMKNCKLLVTNIVQKQMIIA